MRTQTIVAVWHETGGEELLIQAKIPLCLIYGPGEQNEKVFTVNFGVKYGVACMTTGLIC